MHASPFAFCHASPDMLNQINDKSSEVFISKSGKNTIHFAVHRLLFIDYCSRITVHRLLFMDYCSLLLFMTLFTPKFCLFKGGCPLNLRASQAKF